MCVCVCVCARASYTLHYPLLNLSKPAVDLPRDETAEEIRDGREREKRGRKGRRQERNKGNEVKYSTRLDEDSRPPPLKLSALTNSITTITISSLFPWCCLLRFPRL